MTQGLKTICARCHGEAFLVLGVSAPMTMPGQEEPLHAYQVQLLSPVSGDDYEAQDTGLSATRTRQEAGPINVLSRLGIAHVTAAGEIV